MVALVGPLGWSLTYYLVAGHLRAAHPEERKQCVYYMPAHEDVGHCIADAFRRGGLDSDTDRYQ